MRTSLHRNTINTEHVGIPLALRDFLCRIGLAAELERNSPNVVSNRPQP